MARLLYPAPEEAPATITLQGPRFHHLVHVLRLQVGDRVEVFDGRGRSFPGQVASVGRSSAEISLGPPTASAVARRVTLVQSLPKAQKMEWIIQKGTELG